MKIRNKNDLPQALVNAISISQHNKEGCYSATTLLHGVREILLTKRHWNEIEVDVEDCIWQIFGTAVHLVMEKAPDNTFKEEYFEVPVSKSKLTGQIDCYDMEHELIIDWKTASVWKIKYNNFDDWQKQGMLYAYLLHENGLSAKYCEFIALLKDYSQAEANRNNKYPQSKCYKYGFTVTPEDIEITKNYVLKKIKMIEECTGLMDDELPVCSKEERWADDEKWAVMKEGRKSAIKVCNDEKTAQDMAERLGSRHYVQYRPAVSRKCEGYCICKDFCSFYNNQIKSKEIRNEN